MLYLSEWLPNPNGADHGAEWIELGNSGNASVSLTGWSLSSGASKRTVLAGGSVPPHGLFLLPQSAFHFILRNSDESIFLFDPQGNLVGESHFFGVAPSGKSVNHSTPLTAGHGTAGTFFAAPTPGAPNADTGTALIASQYPSNGVIFHSLRGGDIAGLVLGTALLAALCVTIAIIWHDHLRELFFPKHEEIR